MAAGGGGGGSNITQLIPITTLPGIKLANGFCLHPSKPSELVFIADIANEKFIQVDLSSGEQLVMNTTWPRSFVPRNRFASLIAVTRKTKLLIYALFLSKDKNKLFIVIFSVEDDSITKIKEHFSGISAAETKTSISDFQLDEQGYICCYTSHRIDRNRTVFKFTNIGLDENGEFIATDSPREKMLIGNWHRSLVLTDSYYSLSVRDFSFFTKLCRIPCNGNSSTLIDIKNAEEIIELQHIYYNSPGEIVASEIFFYALVQIPKEKKTSEERKREIEYHKAKAKGIPVTKELEKEIMKMKQEKKQKEKEKIEKKEVEEKSILLILDWKQKSVRKVDIKINGHVISSGARLRYCHLNDYMYLNGRCSALDCEDKTHIFIFNLGGNVQENLEASDESPMDTE